jgi:hypothetical protein
MSIWRAPDGADGSAVLCCMRSKQLLPAAEAGETATVAALLARGADVHFKDDDGYGSSGLHPRAFGVPPRQGRTVRPLGAGAARVPVRAVQEDGAALGVGEGSHGDGGGAGEGGRRRALQKQRRVRLSGFILVWLRC